ncbi:hypothetical protein FS837_003668 [Tulasnella sp. UAMH 9824]|nr:hypothetical protein FS837_003668 [Tulasnella sp. UAMH 9824]
MRDSDNLRETLRALGHAHTALAQIYDLDLHDSRENRQYLEDHPQLLTIAPLDDDPDELDDLRILHEVTGIACQVLAESEELFGGREGTRGPYFQFAKSEDFFQRSLSWPDRWFRRVFRMSRATFDRVVALLEKNDVFQSSGKRPQRPVKFQLACFLIRYGVRGAETLDPAQKVSLGHGTVFLYCRRVVYAIRCLRHSFVQWPNREKRQENAEAVEEKTGIPGVIGIVDGSLIPFARVPKIDAHLWFTRKKFAGVSQAPHLPVME